MQIKIFKCDQFEILWTFYYIAQLTRRCPAPPSVITQVCMSLPTVGVLDCHQQVFGSKYVGGCGWKIFLSTLYCMGTYI